MSSEHIQSFSNCKNDESSRESTQSDSSTDLSSFSNCKNDEDARTVVQQRYNNIVVEAMESDIDPMMVANELHDLAEMTKIQLHRESAQNSSDAQTVVKDNDSDGEDKHPLS